MTAVEDLINKHSHKRRSQAEIKEMVTCDNVDEAKCEADIKNLIDSNEIVVFSKSYCPYCRQAKMALRSVPDLEFAVVEMNDGEHEGWQAKVGEVAKSMALPELANNNTLSVPQIFIKKQYIGGANDLADMFQDQRLATMLGRSLS